MQKENLFEHIEKLQGLFQDFFQHRKKVTALENHSLASPMPLKQKNALALVKGCLKDGFLEEEESVFLDWMLKKVEMNYLDWAHKTKWVKSKIEKRKKKVTAVQTFFDFAMHSQEKVAQGL